MENIQTGEKTPNLTYAHLAPEVWAALGKIPRTGWVNRHVKNPESVQEHTIALRELASSFKDLTEDEKDGLLNMLEIHDWPEVIHGDQAIVTNDEEEKRLLKATKYEKEKEALTTICARLGEDGKKIMDLWLRFENSNDPAASFARQLDKYQAIKKALEYEHAQGIALFKEFLDYDRKRITHPILVKGPQELESEASA